MMSGEWLLEAVERLERAGIATARLDALVLLEDCLHTNRAQLLAHPETPLSPEQKKALDLLVARRATHEPLAYIRNKTEFYGREFYIDYRVLEPRPESETLIDRLKELPLAKDATLVDVGTGSGALAITAKLELPRLNVMGIDIDSACLKVAHQNAEALAAEVHFIKGDLIRPMHTHYHPKVCVLLCNLPYVPDNFQINPAAMREPRQAIFGGTDGLDLYRQLFEQIDPLAFKPQYILTESLPPQHDMLENIARSHGYQLEQTNDFVQVFTRP